LQPIHDTGVGTAPALLTTCQQAIDSFSFASPAPWFPGDDVDETQKNIVRQVTLTGPAQKLRFRDAEVNPKLFITANNFRRAPQCALVNILKHGMSSLV
jgi:hypothetical protein